MVTVRLYRTLRVYTNTIEIDLSRTRSTITWYVPHREKKKNKSCGCVGWLCTCIRLYLPHTGQYVSYG